VHVQTLCARGAAALQGRSANVEDAVCDLISVLCDSSGDELDQTAAVDDTNLAGKHTICHQIRNKKYSVAIFDRKTPQMAELYFRSRI